MEKMMTKIWAIGIFAVLATGIALASAQPSLAPEPATDEEAARIRDQIEKWKENPEMQIAASEIDRGIRRVTLWVYERTPENQQLHHTMIDGWEIIVAESPEPSLYDAFYDILTFEVDKAELEKYPYVAKAVVNPTKEIRVPFDDESISKLL